MAIARAAAAAVLVLVLVLDVWRARRPDDGQRRRAAADARLFDETRRMMRP